MGNHIVCDNYYCQSIHYKPDWISKQFYHFLVDKDTKYTIDKGTLSLLPSPKISLLFQKKLNIDSSIHEFILPIHFHFDSSNPLHLFILLTPSPITSPNISDLNSLKNSSHSFFSHLIFEKNIFDIDYSNIDTSFHGKIHSSKKYIYTLHFKEIQTHSPQFTHSFESNSKKKISQFHSPLLPFSFIHQKDIYMSVFIFSSSPFLSSHTFQMNFD
jgi:hypothetical protein